MKNILLIVPIMVGLILGGVSVSFYLKTNDLNHQLHQAKQIVKKQQEEAKRLESEKEKLARDNEKLQADAISYIGINTDLQKEKDNLGEELKKMQGEISSREMEVKQISQKLKEMDKKAVTEKRAENGKLAKEKAQLEEKITFLEGILKKERGLYHYNLAVAYTEAKLYDEAVDSYNKSLEFNSGNPDAHYNLGILYENFKGDPEMAISHYRKYLELNPNADDKEEVTGWIEKLSS